MIAIIFLLSLGFINAQEILWDIDITSEISKTGYINDIFLDSSKNIYLLYSNITTEPQAEYIKVNANGDVVFRKSIFEFDIQNNEKAKIPISVKLAENSSFVFMGLAQEKFYNLNESVLPILVKYNLSFEPVDTIEYYNSSDNNDFLKYGFKINTITKNNIYYNNKFFNVTIEDYERFSENPNNNFHNILVMCYDTTGKLIWGNSFGKTSPSSVKYLLKDLIVSDDGNLVILCHKYLLSGSEWKQSELKVLIVNEFGSEVISFDYQKNEKYYPICISQFGDGFIVLNQLSSTKIYNSYFISIFSKSGDLIAEYNISDKYLKMSINALLVNKKNEILLIGKYLIDYKDPTNPTDDIGKLFIVKFNSDFTKIWEFESHDMLLSENQLLKAVNTGTNEFILVGYKNRYNRYISKISDLNTNISIQKTFNEKVFVVSPNPATDYVEVAINNVILSEAKNQVLNVKVYNVLGLEVATSPTAPLNYGEGSNVRLNISGLAPGVYFVRVGSTVQKFVKL